MTKNELIALTNQVREKIEKLRAEMTSAIDSASETDGDDYNLPYNEFSCAIKFCALDDTLDDFVRWLEKKKDLPEGEMVMCKAHESELDGWRLQYYWQKGQTLISMENGAIHSGWLYIVPLRYFKPTSTDWRPEEKYNWANFGKGE